MKKLALLGVLAVILFLGCPSTAVETITVTPAADTTGIGLTAQFTATAYDVDGNEVSDVDFTWTSSSTATATVDNDGLATGVATGACVITATSGDIVGTAALVVTSGPTHHSGAIVADETWYPVGNPHVIDDDVSVENNATLTILPGCVVKFDPQTELYVGWAEPGAIIANGKIDTTIIFSSNVTSPSAGDYDGIGLYQFTMNTTSFRYCTIEYAGYSGFSVNLSNNTNVKINNCTIRNGLDLGVRLNGTTCRFSEFANNTITGLTGTNAYPINIEPDNVWSIGAGNSFTANTYNSIKVEGGSVVTTGTWLNQGIPYQIMDDINIGGPGSPILTIAPGTTIKLYIQSEFYVGWSESGGLIADGSTGRITFTSAVASPAPGDWAMVSFYGSSIDAQSMIKNCNVKYGGYDDQGNIYIFDSNPEISGDSIGNSLNYGIYYNDSYVHPDSTTMENANYFFSCPSGNVGHN